jgi:hypothetical protein
MLQTFLLTSGLDVEDNVQSVETMDNEIVMEALGSGQFCKVTTPLMMRAKLTISP